MKVYSNLILQAYFSDSSIVRKYIHLSSNTVSEMYMLKGGAVPIPRWILVFRFLQLFFAVLIIALISFSLSVNGGGPLQPGLIPVLVIACLTTLPILVFTTPLHLAQRRIYDPRIALCMDGIALLFWLGAFAALAAYQRIFKDYGFGICGYSKRNAHVPLMGSNRARALLVTRNDDGDILDYYGHGRCARAWKTGAVAAWFSGVEFFLFLLTTLIFLYYYHLHMAGDPMSATSGTRKTEQGAIISASPGAGATTAATRPGEYPMHSVPENGEPASTRAGMHTGVYSGPRVVEGGPSVTGGAGGITGAHAG